LKRSSGSGLSAFLRRRSELPSDPCALAKILTLAGAWGELPDEADLEGCGEVVDLLPDDRARGGGGTQVARRYAVNANLIFKWLRDPPICAVAKVDGLLPWQWNE